MDRVIDPSAGFDEALACYTGAMRQIEKALPAKEAVKNPWWKFW
jgi:hypothetical protein